MKQKYIQFSILGILGLTGLISVISVYAWTDLTTYQHPGAPDAYECGPDTLLVATDGDVVTTDKWNRAMCWMRASWHVLSDWPRGRTYFLGLVRDSENVPIVSEINFPSTIQNSDGYSAGIHFKDPTLSYNDVAGYRGGIQYNGGSDRLDFFDFSGGLRIADSVANKGYYIGWEKVNLYGTENFDTDCQYRFTTNGGWLLFPDAMSLTAIRGQFNSATNGESNHDISIIIHAATKSHYNTYGGDSYGSTNPSSISYGDGTITKMEKLCLPSYNPYGY